MSKPKTGNDLDTAAKGLKIDPAKKQEWETGSTVPEDHKCEHCEILNEELAHAMGVVLRAIDHLGPDGIVSLGYNDNTGEKFKAVFKKEMISDAEFKRIKAEQDAEVKRGAWWGSTNGFSESDNE